MKNRKWRTKGQRKLASRLRKRTVARMLEDGRSVSEMARLLGCAEDAVRQCIIALRRETARQAAEEWGSAAAGTADLVEAFENVLRKARSAQASVEKEANLRGFIQLEIQALRELLAVRREVLAAREPEERPIEEYTAAEMLTLARDLGIDTGPYEHLLRPGQNAADEDNTVDTPAAANEGDDLDNGETVREDDSDD